MSVAIHMNMEQLGSNRMRHNAITLKFIESDASYRVRIIQSFKNQSFSILPYYIRAGAASWGTLIAVNIFMHTGARAWQIIRYLRSICWTRWHVCVIIALLAKQINTFIFDMYDSVCMVWPGPVSINWNSEPKKSFSIFPIQDPSFYLRRMLRSTTQSIFVHALSHTNTHTYSHTCKEWKR